MVNAIFCIHCQPLNITARFPSLSIGLHFVVIMKYRILTFPREFRAHIFKHHGLEAHAKYVEKVHEKKFKEPGMCDTCGKHVEDQRVHLLAWHPDISAPKMYNEILKKPIRKLSEKPRWAERLNKRQRVLVKEGKLPATPDDGDGAEISRQGDGSVRYGYGKETTDQSSSSQH